MMTQKNKLQLYFDYYIEHFNPKADGWYIELKKAFEYIDVLRKEITLIDTSNLDENQLENEVNKAFQESYNKTGFKVNKDKATIIQNIQGFIEWFIFSSNNKIGKLLLEY